MAFADPLGALESEHNDHITSQAKKTFADLPLEIQLLVTSEIIVQYHFCYHTRPLCRSASAHQHAFDILTESSHPLCHEVLRQYGGVLASVRRHGYADLPSQPAIEKSRAIHHGPIQIHQHIRSDPRRLVELETIDLNSAEVQREISSGRRATKESQLAKAKKKWTLQRPKPTFFPPGYPGTNESYARASLSWPSLTSLDDAMLGDGLSFPSTRARNPQSLQQCPQLSGVDQLQNRPCLPIP